MSQHQYQTEQANPSPSAHSGPTFQRPTPQAYTPHGSTAYDADQAADMRQQMQAPHAASTSASAATQPAGHPQPLAPGGQGPLSGLAAQRPQPVSQSMPQSMEPAPSLNAGPETPPIAADQRPVRPSFPAAPSKVLAEQLAMGGDGYIRQTAEGPAFDGPAYDGPMLEGAYPHPQSLSPAAPAGQPAQSERPRPRLQHADPAYQDQFSHDQFGSLDEPNLSMRPAGQAYSQGAYPAAGHAQSGSAFWQFEGGEGQPRQGERRDERGTMAPFILLGVLLLAFMIGWGAWASWRAWQSSGFASVPAQPVVITAPEGPERIVPADRGGREIAGTGFSVLNPEAEVVNGELAPMPATPEGITGGGFIADSRDVFAIDEAIQPEIAFDPGPAAAPVVAPIVAEAAPEPAQDTPAAVPSVESLGPNYQADVIRPVARSQPIPAAFGFADPQPADPASAATQPQPAQQPAPEPTEPGLVTTPPTGVYVQEGSYSTYAAAQQAFAALVARAPSMMQGIAASYHKVEVNGQIFYRLYLTGWMDETAARTAAPYLGRTQSNWLVKNG